MGDVKQASFRLNEEGIEKFKELTTEQDCNQAEMFDKLLENFKNAKAKGLILDRAKEVETFENTATTLVSMFVNSLAVNQNAEGTLRIKLSEEINLKDTTIKDLQEQREGLKTEVSSIKESSEILKKQNKELEKELDNLKSEFTQKTNIINSQQSQINTLNAIVDEYKEYKDINVKLENENKELLLRDSALEHINVDLQSQIKNSEQMISFYKEEVDELKQDKVESTKQLKEVENMYKSDLQAEKQNSKVTLEAEFAKIKETFDAKLQLEKDKMGLEIDKLKLKNDTLEGKNNDLISKIEANKVKITKQIKTKEEIK